MITNYHTHTTRCMHAVGTEREYVETAIANGVSILGFADHTPQPYPDGYVSHIRMGMEQLEDYVNTVLRLKEEYKNEIEIHLGLETEYFPQMFDELLTYIEAYPIEYFLLGQHFLEDEMHGVYSGERTRDENILKRYCELCEEAMATGRFSYLAHPDLLHFTGESAVYRKWMRRLCESAKRLNIPLEINLLGLRTHRHYPNPQFWEIAGETGNEVIFGFDAHQADQMQIDGTFRRAEKMVEKYQLNRIEVLKLRRPVEE